jgi:glycosyltransferase involved in cell wall biosynthesis
VEIEGGTGELPLVSVVVATFNRAHMIEQTLRSIAAQTYGRLETVVVDDGSTDATEDVVERVGAATGLDIVYSKQTNAGCAAARNAGVELATGELIVFLDSDDQWLPDAAEAMVDELRASGADFVYAPSIEVYPQAGWRGREVVVLPPAARRPESFAAEHFLDHGVRQGAFMVRRQVFLDLGGMDVSLSHNEDSDFVQRVAIRLTGAYVSLPTVRCYHHLGNKSGDRPSIYYALIASNLRTLREFPEFACSVHNRADAKVRNLRVKLVEELSLAGRLDEARSVADEVDGRLPKTVRVALRTGMTQPLLARRFARRMVDSVRVRSATRLARWRQP